MEKIGKDVYIANTEKAVDFGYWYGTYGQLATVALWNSKKRQYPEWYDDPSHIDELDRWLGKHVLDCIGLDKFARWLQPDGTIKYDAKSDFSANGMFSYAKQLGMEFGPITTIPDIPGICVRKNKHFGIYIGKGMSRESRGGNYGVEDHPIKDYYWTDWFYNPFVDYTEEVKETDYTVICTALNVRSGPGTENNIVAVRHNGDFLHVTEIIGSWGHHQAGWSNIGSPFCKPVNGQPSTPATPSTAPVSQTTVETYAGWPTLRYGMRDNAYVKKMQTALILKGYKIPAGATGNYLSQTEDAVLAFLKKAGLISAGTSSAKNIAWGKRCWFALLG